MADGEKGERGKGEGKRGRRPKRPREAESQDDDGTPDNWEEDDDAVDDVGGGAGANANAEAATYGWALVLNAIIGGGTPVSGLLT